MSVNIDGLETRRQTFFFPDEVDSEVEFNYLIKKIYHSL